MTHLVFDEENHTYTLDGSELPSVTQICRPLTVDISENAKPWLRDAAAQRGTRVHEICAEIDLIGSAEGIEAPPDISGYIRAYLDFLRDYRIRSWDAVEMPLGSSKLGYAGTIDRVGMIDGKRTIIDLKTGSRIDKATLTAQLNGYRYLWEYTQRERVDGMCGLKLGRNGNYQLIPVRDSDIFICLMTLYHERRAIYGK